MSKMTVRKRLAFVMSLIMIFSLFAGMTFSVSAAYTPTGTMTALWNSGSSATTGSIYSISSELELSYLASYTSNGRNTTGVTFYLTGSITLTTSPWKPIGTQSDPFNGTFDGSNQDPANPQTISGLSITDSTGTSYFGLFGYSTGPIKNVKVNGSITITNPTTQYAGGVVGYTTSDVYNVQTNVAISAPGVTHVGGIAGAIENTATTPIVSPFKIQACSAKGNVTGGSRTGGIVGAVYCGYAGNVVVDNCFFSNGGVPASLTLATTSTSSRAWVGGIVGYDRGFITNCYAVATLQTTGGHYVCGIAGLLQGSGPQAYLGNSYAAVVFGTGTDPNDDLPLAGSVDNSNTLLIANSLYDSSLAGAHVDPVGTGSAGWGYWQQTGFADTTPMKSNGSAQVYNGSTSGSAVVLNVLGSAYSADTGSTIYNSGYPILKWQSNYTVSNLPTYVPGNGSTNIPLEVGIFLDGVNGDDTNSGTTRNTPVKTIDQAVYLAHGGTIYVINTVTLTGTGTELNFGTGGNLIIRSAAFGGVMFVVPANVTSYVANVTIDGNKTNVASAYSLFSVTGGRLSIGDGATLQNNSAPDGGAINITSGSVTVTGTAMLLMNDAKRGGSIYVGDGGDLTISGGTIGKGTAQNNGGAISTRGIVTISGGSISGNSAVSTGTGSNALGGGIAIMAGSVTMSGGTVASNTATTNGGGVYIEDIGSFTLTGGTIESNSALNGNGIYVSASNTLTLAPPSGAGLTFGSNDTVYLPESVTFNVNARLDNGMSSSLPLAFANPQQFDVVAIAASNNVANNSSGRLVSGTIQFSPDTSVTPPTIIISSLTL